MVYILDQASGKQPKGKASAACCCLQLRWLGAPLPPARAGAGALRFPKDKPTWPGASTSPASQPAKPLSPPFQVRAMEKEMQQRLEEAGLLVREAIGEPGWRAPLVPPVCHDGRARCPLL